MLHLESNALIPDDGLSSEPTFTWLLDPYNKTKHSEYFQESTKDTFEKRNGIKKRAEVYYSCRITPITSIT